MNFENSQKVNLVKLLNQSELDSIHEASLKVLEKTGVTFESEKARKIFQSAGAKVHNNVIKIPREVVTKAIEEVPSEIILASRDPSKNLLLGKGNTYYTNGFGATIVKDLNSGKLKKATLKDLEKFTLLSDCLSNVHDCLSEVSPQDVPPRLVDIYQASTLLKNTDKHVRLAARDSKYYDHIIKLGEIASSDSNYPVFSLGCTPITPLKYTKDQIIKLEKATSKGIPFSITSGAITGASSPITLSGTLIVQNAEILAGITLTQLINPGSPVMYGSFASPMDMRTGKQLWGCPEISLLNAATSKLCKLYEIPFGYGTGGVSDCSISGVQAGVEKTFTVLYAALAGIEVIHDAVSGLLGSARIASYEQLIIDNEICQMVNRVLEGISVNTETQELDLIHKVGPGGSYIAEKHTVLNFRKELFISELWDREIKSSKSNSQERENIVLKRARKKVKQILIDHEPNRLDSEKENAIDKIVKNLSKG